MSESFLVPEPFRGSTFSDARAFSGVSTFMVQEPFLVSAIFLCLKLLFVEMRTESRLRGVHVDWGAVG
jgi:hypothetical protein